MIPSTLNGYMPRCPSHWPRGTTVLGANQTVVPNELDTWTVTRISKGFIIVRFGVVLKPRRVVLNPKDHVTNECTEGIPCRLALDARGRDNWHGTVRRLS